MPIKSGGPKRANPQFGAPGRMGGSTRKEKGSGARSGAKAGAKAGRKPR